MTVAYPFLLRCYHDYKQDQLSEADFGKVLHLVENMVIRRYVCNLPSNALNKLFPVAYREAQLNCPTEFVEGVVRFLQSKGYPNDEMFKEALTTTTFYGRSDGRERIKLILESLESSHQHKEQVDFKNLSVEHIMPQTIPKDSWWSDHLGEDWETIRDLYLHTLGNLTLTGYNSELSNKSFPEKQKELAQSHLELNRYFLSLSEWKEEQIKERAEKLSALALRVWPYFGDNNRPVSTGKGVKRTKPSRLIIKNMEFAVKTWRDVLEQTLNWLAKEEESELFKELATKYPKVISNDANVLRRPIPLTNGYHVEINASAEHIYRFCQQVMEHFDYSKDDWRVDYQYK